MEHTNEKKLKNKSFFSKSSSISKKQTKISTPKDNIEKNKISKTTNMANSTATSITDTTHNDLDTILKINDNAKIAEYYDLPYRYNQTVIKILAQTPHSIFIYWDISDSDKFEMKQKYGKNFFSETKPVLLVHNKTYNYSFEIEVDDFTNSWYLRTPTSNCEFNIDLGRKKIFNDNSSENNNILSIVSSNTIKSPNDHILTESFNKPIYFKNIKTNELEEIDVSNKVSTKNLYNIFELHKKEFISNPSSDFKI